MIPAVSWVPRRVVRFARKAADPPFKKNGALCSEEDVQTMDPYLKDNDIPEELEDLTIHPKDTIIACVRNKHGLCHLEVSIHEDLGDGDSNLYVHHDVVLSAHALCAVRLGRALQVGKEGNFIAVGSFLSSIEIWDLNIVDEMQPTLVLGRNYKIEICRMVREMGKELTSRTNPRADFFVAKNVYVPDYLVKTFT